MIARLVRFDPILQPFCGGARSLADNCLHLRFQYVGECTDETGQGFMCRGQDGDPIRYIGPERDEGNALASGPGQAIVVGAERAHHRTSQSVLDKDILRGRILHLKPDTKFAPFGFENLIQAAGNKMLRQEGRHINRYGIEKRYRKAVKELRNLL